MKRLSPRHVSRTLGALVGVGFVALSTPCWADFSGAVRHSAREVGGLAAPAEIVVDHWGIPHIYAGSPRDAFFVQGYNAARDRLWQIDLWRKRGLGLLARDFGPRYASQDRAARLFLYRGDMNPEWAAYGPQAKSSAEAFVLGVNAFVREVRDGLRPLPPEFRVAGTRPDFWSSEDVVRIRSHGLTRNVMSEVRRAEVACAAGVEADRLRFKLEPAWTTKVPEGLDPCAIPRDVLADYELATREVSFGQPGRRSDKGQPASGLAGAPPTIDSIGSNNWVISGSRTATGRPILANDPHRAHSVPSLRYIVQLEAPGLSVIGAGEPALPGISIGHNDNVAFGLTIFNVDQEDMYVYDLNPANPDEYRYGSGYEAMRIVRETVEIKGEGPREIEMRFTRHGPVLAFDPAGHRAFALRSTWFEPGTSAYFGSSDYMTAANWDGFLAAMTRWGAPSENQVYADVSGNIGWVAAGRTPVRPNWDGLMPVPGDGRYEWQGFRALEELPGAFNPPEGWLATANQMNLPPDYPAGERKIGFEWTNSSRYARIASVLAANPASTLADSMALQMDDTSTVARRLVAVLKTVHATDPAVSPALELLTSWNGKVTSDSAAAALFEVWMAKHLGKAVIARAAPEAVRPLLGNGDIAAITDLLADPDASLGADPVAARDAVVSESLAAAVGEVALALGSDMSRWTWGRLHHAEFHHALEPVADDAMKAQMQVGRLAMGGSAYTPHAATYRFSDFRVTAGASFRVVMDVGNWDESVAVNTPGQSGNPFSPHYRDLAPLWAAGEYVPLLFSRGAVERSASEVIALTPKAQHERTAGPH